MGLIGKFVSNAWNVIKNGLGTAGKLIQSGANKAWNFVKDNQDTIGKIAGTALGTGINLYTGGAAAPFINGANNFIQDLPDNAFTKHLKNIAKGAISYILDKSESIENLIYNAPGSRNAHPYSHGCSPASPPG